MTIANTEQLLLEELIIDPEFASVIPPLTQQEFDQLRKNILEDKEVFHPIIIWTDTIDIRLLKRTRTYHFEHVSWVLPTDMKR